MAANTPLAASDARSPDYRGHVPLVYYRPGEWKRRLVSDAEEGVMHGIFITDWDHDGGTQSSLVASLGFTYIGSRRTESGREWKLLRAVRKPWPKSGTSDVAVGQFGGKRFLAAIERWHGNEVVVYQGSGQSLNRVVIDDTLSDAHTIDTINLNGNGRDAIIVGFRGKPYRIYIYRFRGTKWDRQILDPGGVSAASCAAADLDQDRKPEIACIGQATHNLVLWHVGP